MNKGTELMKAKIKQYLDEFASHDEAFARKYANEEKNLDQCIDFIIDQVQKSGCNGFADDEIYGMAVHYYDEEDLGKISKHACNVVINEQVKLTDEEIEEAKRDARERVAREEQNRIKENERKAKEKAKKKAEAARAAAKEAGEVLLFDGLFGDETEK